MRTAPAIDLIYFNAGAGHRRAATALSLVLQREHPGWAVRLVNLQQVLEPIDVVRRLSGRRIEDVYNAMLERGLTYGSRYALVLLHALIDRYHTRIVRRFDDFWRTGRPDMVVSLIPNFNRALCESLRGAAPEAPFVTVLTDLADYPPHFWIERQRQYLIVGSARAREQALAAGHSDARVFQATGMILHPSFYEVPAVDAGAERRRLGLAPDRPTCLVMFGGHGSRAMPSIVSRLGRVAGDLQLIAICGHNGRLADRLKRVRPRLPMRVEGFTNDIPYYMRISDFLIGKAGPGSVSEAVHMRLPVIVERNARTLPQERYNTDWIRERGLGVVVRTFRRVDRAVQSFLRPERLQAYKANTAAIQNRAVFEMPTLLQTILRAGP